jgi:DNA-binding Lrp family transcriptional regulator
MTVSDATEPKKPLDRIDRALLRALSQDARASGAALAAAVGVAESTVSLRLRALRRRGLVRGYRAEVDLAALGVSLQAMIAVRLGRHGRSTIDDFRARAVTWPGVISLFHTSGADDYLLHVAARDADGLRDFVLQHVASHPAVQHAETHLIFEHAPGSGWQDLVD